VKGSLLRRKWETLRRGKFFFFNGEREKKRQGMIKSLASVNSLRRVIFSGETLMEEGTGRWREFVGNTLHSSPGEKE